MATFLEIPGVKAGPGTEKLGIYSTTNSNRNGGNSQNHSLTVDFPSCGDSGQEAIDSSAPTETCWHSETHHPGFPDGCRFSSMELRKRGAIGWKRAFHAGRTWNEPVNLRHLSVLFLAIMASTITATAQEPTIAVVGMVHSHVWGHFDKMLKGQPAKLVGVAETEPLLINEAVKRGLSRDLVYADYRKLIDEKKPLLVWAFVENSRHLEVVEYCAPRKVHVIFEKPLAATYKDALKIRDLARKHGIKVMTNYQMAWWPTMQALKTKLDSGELGTVWRIHGIVGHGGPGSATGLNRFFFNWLTDPQANGAGALMDFGCYNALWSLMYLGRPETVFAHTIQLRPGEFPKVEDSAAILLTYKKGVALLEGSWDLPRSFQQVEIFGLKGSLFANRQQATFQQGREVKTLPDPGLPAHRLEPIAYMLECIRTNLDPEGMVSMDFNIGVNEIIEAAKLSVKSGKAVSLPLK